MGLQTNGTDFSGRDVGDQVIFSVWSGTDAQPGPGALCGSFGGEGTGQSCHLTIPWTAGTAYRYELANVGGSRWQGTLVDMATAQRHSIGSITAPAERTAITSLVSFDEFFGSQDCASVQGSAAQFELPTLDGVALPFRSSVLGSCGSGGVRDGSGGVGVRLMAGSVPDPPPPPAGVPSEVRDGMAREVTMLALARRVFAPADEGWRGPVLAWRPGRGGSALRLTLSEAARIRFVVERRRGRGWVRVAVSTLRLRPGRSNLWVTGRRSSGARLPAGEYRLAVEETDAVDRRSRRPAGSFRLLA